MKKIASIYLLSATLLITAFGVQSCKNGNKDKTSDADTTTVMVPEPAPAPPVTISPDEELNKNAADAVKDFPGVNATVSNGELTLTGTIERSKLPKLMMSVNATQPKKVNNNLTITN